MTETHQRFKIKGESWKRGSRPEGGEFSVRHYIKYLSTLYTLYSITRISCYRYYGPAQFLTGADTFLTFFKNKV